MTLISDLSTSERSLVLLRVTKSLSSPYKAKPRKSPLTAFINYIKNIFD